jgi:hypothetical protein
MSVYKIRGARFDDPNLLSHAGLTLVKSLAVKVGLPGLLGTWLSVPRPNSVVKSLSLIWGMAAGADSIDDMDVLRAGATPDVVAVRAPSTLGTYLRGFTYGHVRQLDAVNTRLIGNLVRDVPGVLAKHQMVFVDLDDTIKQTYGHQKQGSGYGYNKKLGINAQVATISTTASAPLIAASSLRRGPTRSGKAAWKMAATAITTVRDTGATGVVLVRADSAYYQYKLVTTVIRAGARYSITVRHDKAITAAITAIPDDAWDTIHYPKAVWDDDTRTWISDAEVAETPYVAFRSKGKKNRVATRLIVRRVKRLNPAGQDSLVEGWRYHGFITNSDLDMIEADKVHRHHAIIEQTIAELKNNALAHLPSGRFAANAAWLAHAMITFNLARGLAVAARMPTARWASVTRRLVAVPARIAHSARSITLHLPTQWPWARHWRSASITANAPPVTLAA